MLYKLVKDRIESSVRMEIRTPQDVGLMEADIENFLKSRLHEIVSEDQLMLIGQERKLQEEADLLALDKDGTLYIFELKRWESNSENLLQVMRYGQIFGRYPYQQLEDLAKRQQKLEGCLKEKHKEYFDLDKELSDLDFNKNQVFVLVTNGMDKDTISAVNYWSQKGVRIECSPYRIYEIAGEPYIQFDTYNPDDEVIPEENTGIFIVNTNKTYMPNAWRDMIGNRRTGKAAAYYDRKRSICNISMGSRVYLYHTGIGVIAKGDTIADYKATAYKGDKNEEFFIRLRFDWALPKDKWNEKAPKAWQINQQLGSGYRFRQTVFAIPKEMANAIDDIYSENRKE